MKNSFEENQTLEIEFTNPEISTLNTKHQLSQWLSVEKDLNIEMRYSCSVCGMDSWCGTDGCPLDPQ